MRTRIGWDYRSDTHTQVLSIGMNGYLIQFVHLSKRGSQFSQIVQANHARHS